MSRAARACGWWMRMAPALGFVLAAGVFSCTPVHAQSNASANGVIVQLRDAAANVPPSMKAQPQHVKGLSEAARWQAVLKASDLLTHGKLVAADLNAAPRIRPVGASAQLLSYGRLLTPTETQRLIEHLSRHPDVAWVVPNERETRHQVGSGAANPPNDPLFAGVQQQWWLQTVRGGDTNTIEDRLRGVPGFQSAWAVQTGQAVVAILDTGITPHPELEGRLLPGHDFVSDWDADARRGRAADGDGRDEDPSDPGDGLTAADIEADPQRYAGCTPQPSSWHGTIIAGMLAGLTDNGRGGAAMQWNGRVVPVRVASKCGAEVADVIDGMRWAAGLPVAGAPLNANPARILNMSFGGNAPCNVAYQQAIAEVGLAPGGGAVLVASAGNRWSTPSRPSNCPGAYGVSALNRDGFKTNYASFGASVAVSTVGGDDGDGRWGTLLADSGLLTITNLGEQQPAAAGHSHAFGSSFAAPLVSGVAALMLSVNPALTLDQIKAGLTVTARPHVRSPYLESCSDDRPGRCACTTSTCGAGILDAEQAVLYARDPEAYVPAAAAGAVLDNEELRQAAALGADRPPNTEASTVSRGGGAVGAVWAWWLIVVVGAVGLQRLRARHGSDGSAGRRHRAVRADRPRRVVPRRHCRLPSGATSRPAARSRRAS